MPRDLASNSARRACTWLALGVVSVFVACAVPEAASDTICTPDTYSYCRCQNRAEGEHVCREDGRSYGPCEPCETYEDDTPPDDLPTDSNLDAAFLDAGSDADAAEPNLGVCGDGIVQQDEDCDDKNDDDGDGCDSHCALAGKTPFKTNACPGIDVHVWGGKHAPTLVSTTVASGNRRTTVSCNGTTGQTAPDRVFNVIAHVGGTLTVALTDVTYNAFVWAAASCAPDLNESIACANDAATVGPETLTLPVEAGKKYVVFVDGAGSSTASTRQGEFRVTFSIE